MTEIKNDIDLSDVPSRPPHSPPPKRCRVKKVGGGKLTGGRLKKGKIEPFLVKKTIQEPDVGIESSGIESESSPGTTSLVGVRGFSSDPSAHGPSIKNHVQKMIRHNLLKRWLFLIWTYVLVCSKHTCL